MKQLKITFYSLFVFCLCSSILIAGGDTDIIEHDANNMCKRKGAGKACGISTTAGFFTPDNFEKALKKSKNQNRPLLIKGVAFGMNKTGATDPTKGNW